MISRNFSSPDLIFVFDNKIGNGSLNSIRGPHYTVIKTSVFTKETPLVFLYWKYKNKVWSEKKITILKL